MSKLYRARSLLYRRQILQINIRWKALDEIYKIYMLLHRSDLNISEFFRQFFSQSLAENCKISLFWILFTDFCTDFDEILSEPKPICTINPNVKKVSPKAKKGKEYLCIERKVAHSVINARLQHSFDGHRARDTFIFLHIFSLQHFNFLLLSDPMFPFSIFISLFSNRSSSR